MENWQATVDNFYKLLKENEVQEEKNKQLHSEASSLEKKLTELKILIDGMQKELERAEEEKNKNIAEIEGVSDKKLAQIDKAKRESERIFREEELRLKGLSDVLNNLERNLKARESAIGQMELITKEAKELLLKQKTELFIKENNLSSAQTEAQAEKGKIEQDKLILGQQRIQNGKDMLNIEVEKKDLVDENLKLQEGRKDLKNKEEFIKNKEAELNEKEKKLSKEARELSALKFSLEQLKRELDNREADLNKKDKDLSDKQKNIDDARMNLALKEAEVRAQIDKARKEKLIKEG